MFAEITMRWLILFIFLAGCGIRVEVESSLPATPTPVEFPDLDFDVGGVERKQAAPHLTFTDTGNPQVELFMQPDQREVYLVQYRQVWVSVDYDATWFDSPQSNAQIRLSVYIRFDPEEAWRPYDSDEATLVAETIPTTTTDSLGVGVYMEEIVPFEIRAEVTVVAYAADGEVSNQVSTNEFKVIVLADPGEINTDPGSLWPGLGEVDPNMLLLDWRTWYGGPCTLLDWFGDDPSYDTIASACDALNNGDVWAAIGEMQSAGEQTQNVELSALLDSMRGLALTIMGDLDGAAEALQAAVDGYEAASKPFEMAVNLHNLTAVHMMREDETASLNALTVLQELRSQFWDEAGNYLTQANVAFASGDFYSLEQTRFYFADYELPQVDVIDSWMEQLSQRESE